MSYWTNKLTEQNSLIGRPCFYQKPYNTDTTFALIKEVQIKQNAKGKEAIATLDNGIPHNTSRSHGHDVKGAIR